MAKKSKIVREFHLQKKVEKHFELRKELRAIIKDPNVDDEEKNKHVEKLISENFDLSPRGIREMLGLNKPIYEKSAAYGHFGREPEGDGSFSWEKIDKKSIFSK